jgi:hypothetical protein
MVTQEVFRLQIPVEVVVLVHISQSLKSLKHDVSNLMFTKQPPSVLHNLVYVHVQILKHKMQSALL